MATTTVQTIDIAAVLKGLLDEIPDLRAYAYVADTIRPPAAVIGQPSIDWQDNSSGFCSATWEFPITLMVNRASDAEAQRDLSKYVLAVASALTVDDAPGIFSIEPLDARPIPVTLGQTDLPGYLINVRVRA